MKPFARIGELFDSKVRTELLVVSAVRWAERSVQKSDGEFEATAGDEGF